MTEHTDDTNVLLAFGGEIKALGDGKLGGYLVRFTDATRPDLTGDFFTPQTDFDIEPGDRVSVYYNHGLDATLKRRRLGVGTIKLDDAGVWVEAQLALRDEYEQAIYRMAEAGKLGWSSGTLPNLVEREPEGKAARIITWPLGKDASLTPTPAAGLVLTAVQPLKSWAAATSHLVSPGQPADIDNSTLRPEAVATEDARSASLPAVADGHGDISTATTEATMEEVKQAAPPEIDYGKLAAAIVTAQKAAEPPGNPAGFAVEDEADRAVKGNPFKSLGEQLIAVRNAAFGNVDKRLLPLKAILGANESIPSEGGFLVSTAQSNALDKKMWDAGVFANRASNVAIPAGSNSMTFYGLDEDSRANGSRYGGITGYRVAEGGTITASGMQKFYTYTLRPKKYAAVAYATDEVLQDTAVLEQELLAGVPAELAFMVDDDMLNGLGVAGAHGVLNHASLVSVTKEVGQAATTIVYENLIKMWARRYPRGNYAWFVNQDTMPQLHLIAHAVGTGALAPNFVNYNPDGSMRVFGAPVVETEFNATLGTVGDILLADWGQYKLATIGGVQSASSIHVQFLTDQMTYRFTRRVDGLPMWKSALTPYKGTANTVSPFIALATRA